MASDPRKSRIKTAVGALAVDSTLPGPKLLEHFASCKQPTVAYNAYKKLVAQRPDIGHQSHQHYMLHGHPLNTFPEGWDGMLPPRYFERFTYKSTMPMIMTRMRNIGFNDPVSELMRNKYEWSRVVLNAAAGARRLQDALEPVRHNESVMECREDLVELVATIESDPDPLLKTPYNWYYAGSGNMQVMSMNGQDCLLHSEFSKLYLSKFSREKLKVRSKHLATYDCGEGKHILETIINPNSIVALRFKYKVIVLKLTSNEGTIYFKKVKEIDSEIAYTSIAFDEYHKSILYLTKLDCSLKIINMDIMKARSLKLQEPDSLIDNWNKVIAIDKSSYCHISKKTVAIYDKQNNKVVQSWSDPANVSDYKHCNTFTAVKRCEDIPFMYLGTNHHLFLMDIRYQSDYKPQVVRRWNHQMESPPTYISMCKFEYNRDMVCLSSQWSEDTCVIPNDLDVLHENLISPNITLPYRLPTFSTMLHESRSRKHLVDLYNPIEKRLFSLLTGNAIVQTDENCLVVTQNSLGDIFSYTLYLDHMEVDDDESLERLREWSEYNKSHGKSYEMSGIVNIARLWKNLRKVPENRKFGGGKLYADVEQTYNDKEVTEAYESGELDSGLLDLWLNEDNENVDPVKIESLTIDLHFSDSDDN